MLEVERVLLAFLRSATDDTKRVEREAPGRTTTGESQPVVELTPPKTAERTVSADETWDGSWPVVARRYAAAARRADPEASEKSEPYAES